MKIQKKKRVKGALIIALVVVFVLAGGATYWYLDSNGFFGRNDDKKTQNASKSEDAPAGQIDNETTTDSDSDKKGNNDKPPVETDSSGKKVAQIVIVDASQYDNIFEVRAGVNNLAEDNGTCEFTFTRGNNSLSYTSAAIFSGTGIDCQTIDIPVEDFTPKGEWQMVVKYTSPTSAGSSQTKKVMIK
jgi:hypothetical protein